MEASVVEPAISFIVTCKGRLQHLKQTLPALAGQRTAECVVVDYDCPERTYQWVGDHFPEVRVVRVVNQPIFNLARARNLGVASARALWLCFVDTDILLAPDFAARVLPMLAAGHFYRPQAMPLDASGTSICHRDAIRRIEGYDEVIEGWGGEDDDLYRRLAEIGCLPGVFPGSLVRALAHEDAVRMEHYVLKNRWLNQRINSLYLHIKYDLQRQKGPLDLAARQSIYAVVARTLIEDDRSGATGSRIEVNLPGQTEVPLDGGWSLNRRWIYELKAVTR